MGRHICHADGCETAVPPKMFMCRTHWRMAPKELQDRIWATYRPGQERDKQPSLEYLDAAMEAINAVREKEETIWPTTT